MAQVRRANKGTSSADLANVAPGYVASGESEHSRRSARPHASARFGGAPVRMRGRHTLDQQIAECERRIDWMECEQKIEDDPRRREKLLSDLTIRGRFLTKLLIERDGQ